MVRLWNLVRSWFGQGLGNLDDPDSLIRQAQAEYETRYGITRLKEANERLDARKAEVRRLREEYTLQQRYFVQSRELSNFGKTATIVLLALCFICLIGVLLW